MVKVSVIIPTLPGRESLLRRAVDSVLKQSFHNFEIIVVSAGDINFETADSRIKLLVAPGVNVSSARNIGIRASRGEYVAFLDDDDFWKPTKLEKQVRVLDRERNVGLVYTLFRKFPRSSNIHNKHYYDGNVFNKLLFKNFIGTSTVIVRREVLETVGGFDENLVIAEDWDLWLRVSRVTNVIHLPEYLVYYYEPQNQREKYLRYFRGFVRFLEKWKEVAPIDAHISHLLTWMWYGKSCGRIPLSKYWEYKLYLSLPGNTQLKAERIYSRVCRYL